MLRIDREDPICVAMRIDTVEASLAKLRNDKELPKKDASNTDRDDPTRTKPQMDTLEPSRAKLRIDSVDPRSLN